jgi:hypothetical protein
MKDGDLSSTQELAIGNSIEASQGADMDAIYGEAYSEAEDSEGYHVKVYAWVDGGRINVAQNTKKIA